MKEPRGVIGVIEPHDFADLRQKILAIPDEHRTCSYLGGEQHDQICQNPLTLLVMVSPANAILALFDPGFAVGVCAKCFGEILKFSTDDNLQVTMEPL